jgi:hypothetical protein
MMLTRSRAQSIGWAVILAVCLALTLALSFRVNAVRSQVRLTERHIARLQVEKSLLETEFETRANQQQLTALNEVEFGYQAPTAGQYLESERQLADLGKARGPDAPPMIRVAAAEPQPAGDSVLPALVNPLTGKALGAEDAGKARASAKASASAGGGADSRAGSAAKSGPRLAAVVPSATSAANLADRLSRVERLAHVEKAPKVIDRKVVERKVAGSKAEPKQAKATPKPAKAEPKQAKAAPKPVKVEPKQAKAQPAKVQQAKAKPAKAEVKVAKAAAPKGASGAVHVAQAGPAKRPAKSNKVAIE